MDREKLIAAIAITTIIIGAIALICWFTIITGGIFRIILVIITIVAVVYCNL